MSNISHIQLPNGNFYNIKDSNASQIDELTQAEYDALSQAEKTNGTMYLITDGVPEYTVINDSVPIGAIQSYAGASCPYGWLMCDGAAVSRETYSELFAAIGTAYGSGDGSTTFNLPDLRGRVVIGTSSSYLRGDTGGEATVTYGLGNGYAKLGGSSTDIKWDYKTTPSYSTKWKVNGSSGGGYTDSSLDGVALGGTTDAGNNMQPYLVGNYIIKALNTVSSSALEELDPQHILFDMFYPVGSYYETSDATFNPNVQWRGTWVLETAGQVHVSAGTGYTIGSTGGEATHTLTVDEMPSHNHLLKGGNGTTNDYFGGSAADYGLRAAGTAQSEAVITNTGGGGAHNNMQPYIVVNRWHRTA